MVKPRPAAKGKARGGGLAVKKMAAKVDDSIFEQAPAEPVPAVPLPATLVRSYVCSQQR